MPTSRKSIMVSRLLANPSIRPCTWPLRINTSDSPVDRHRDKKAWARGRSWPPSSPLTPDDGLDAGPTDTRRPLRLPLQTAAHHRGVLTALLAGATAGRERAAPHAAPRHGR